MSRPAPTARTLVREATATLSAAGVASPEHDALVLLGEVLGVERPLVLASGQVATEEVQRFAALVERRATREPLQHLTGKAWFRHLELAVGPGVFVPRPETELLAGWAIERAIERAGERAMEQSGARPVVVDLCCGSGAIALSVAQEAPGTQVYAVELDPAAHAWAERNVAGSDIDLRLGDMATAFPELEGSVDVVACNPPYIPLEAFESVAPEARDHDPALALWSGDDGLDAIRVLESRAATLLRPGGWVGAEHADVQGSSAVEVFAASGRWSEVRDHLDLAGRARFVTARLAR